jgi:uncharacterized repeat protein (TIGR03803 family)
MLASDGNLYGCCEDGGAYSRGTLFRVTPERTATTIFDFGEESVYLPKAKPVQAADGFLYGTGRFGGAFNYGGIYRMSLAGDFTLMHSFVPAEAEVIEAPLVQASDGMLYGAAYLGGGSPGYGPGTLFRMSLEGSFELLHQFSEAHRDGASPTGGMVQAADGHLYGVVGGGGPHEMGGIYRLTLDGSLIAVHWFNGANGDWPTGELLPSADGWLYGVTAFGGDAGFGTIFRLSLDGRFQRVHSFLADAAEVHHPNCGLILGSDGALYGTSSSGGLGWGTVYRFAKHRGVDVLYAWPRFMDPRDSLVEAQPGVLVGRTTNGVESAGELYRVIDGKASVRGAGRWAAS